MEQLARCQGIHRPPATTRRLTDCLWTRDGLAGFILQLLNPSHHLAVKCAFDTVNQRQLDTCL